MLSTAVIGWQWLKLETAAKTRAAGGGEADARLYEGKRRASQYWFATEMPRVDLLAARVEEGDDAFVAIEDDAF
jgi:butyryl-CoA dehydrogenase